MRTRGIEKLHKVVSDCGKRLDTLKKTIDASKKDGTSAQCADIIRYSHNLKQFSGSLRSFLELDALVETQLKADPSAAASYADLQRAYKEGRLYEPLMDLARIICGNQTGKSMSDAQFIELSCIVARLVALKIDTLVSISKRRPADK